MTTEVQGAPRTLTAADRCDRCGAQAYFVTTFEAGELLFCAHHGTEHMTKIIDRIVVDNSAELTAEKKS